MNGKLDEQRKIKGSTKEQQIDIESEWTFRIYPNTQIYIYIYIFIFRCCFRSHSDFPWFCSVSGVHKKHAMFCFAAY